MCCQSTGLEKRVYRSRRGRPIILTTLDSASLNHLTDPQWQIANYQLVYNEYYNLAHTLYTNHAGQGGRTFVIANWEGDNLLYCGSAYTYIKDGDISCSHSDFFRDEKAALLSWSQTRHNAIAQAAIDFGTSAPDVTVVDGIEFNSYKFIANCLGESPCLPLVNHGLNPPARPFDVLHDIIPVVKPAYALYSSWESASRADQDLQELSSYLNAIQPPPKKVIGEWGVEGFAATSARPWNPPTFSQSTWVFQELATALRRNIASPSGFTFAVTWQGFLTVDLQDQLLSSEGAEMAGMRTLRGALQAAPGLGSGLQINGVREASRANGKRYFELYGLYPNSETYSISYRCSDATSWASAQNEGQGANQVNASIPESSSDRWCVFRVTGPVSGSYTNEIGPLHSCWPSLCTPVF